MGYQALLFCPEEKLARVVSQVFSELDFTVEPVHEPFAAVKKLMTQRYDAIVVDCENEQNASLLFKSARNSSSNQSSLAIALVEGQAGVAKAYRIGANLVLTKPINVEQAKGTLRVARGLLRKNSDAAAASSAGAGMPAKTAPVSDRSSVQPVPQNAPAFTPPPKPIEPPELEAPLPTIAASAEISNKTAAVFTPAVQAPTIQASTIPAPATQAAATQAPATQTTVASAPKPMQEARQPAALSVTNHDAAEHDSFTTGTTVVAASVPTPSITPAATSFAGSAAATAPAKEATALPATVPPPNANKTAENKTAEFEPAIALHESAYGATPTFGSLGRSDAPTFGALGEEDSRGSSGKKKLVIAAAAILALAALGYVTFGRFGRSGTGPAPQSVTAPSEQQSRPPVLAPMSSPAPAPSTSTIPGDQANITTQPAASKTPAGGLLNKLLNKSTADAANPSANRIAANAEPAAKSPDAVPIVVKANPANAKPQSQPQAEESAPALAVAPANDSSLNGLMSSAPANLARPTLATLRISQGVSQGLLIKRVQPLYPQAALAVHAQGTVQIEATVNKQGSVVNPRVLSGDPLLARAALEAVRQWRYKPYFLDGQPVEIQTQITINFKAN
ncbi:MAG TPA: TonB family protein [Terriglobales bacterium]|jgi:TonB family protein|nr:TonB family protein [Terriglobales bacterium]